MFLVWVRMVFRDTMSSRAMSGPYRSVRSRRRTSSSRSLSGSTRPDLTGVPSSALPKAAQQVTGIVRGDPVLRGGFQQVRHGRTFVDKDADVALRLGQRQGALQRHKRGRDVAAPGGRAPAAPGFR